MEMGCKVVLIKCGELGMYYRTADREVLARTGSRIPLDLDAWAGKTGHQPCFRADTVRSGTGAGDTSIAAFLTAVLAGKTPAESVALACAEGACCVTGYDALSGLRTLPALEERIKSGWATM